MTVYNKYQKPWVVEASVTLIICTFVVALRFYLRLATRMSLQWDDWMALASLVLFILWESALLWSKSSRGQRTTCIPVLTLSTGSQLGNGYPYGTVPLPVVKTLLKASQPLSSVCTDWAS